MNFTNLQIQDIDLPKVEAVVLKAISKSYLKIIILNKLAFYSVLLVLLYIFKVVFEKKAVFEMNIWLLISIVLTFCLINFIIAILAFKKQKYAIREQDVIYGKGLIVYSQTTVPISRIQHVEESRSWLARSFGLSTLKIFTAGEAGSDLVIHGLPYIEALQIKQLISDKLNGNN